MKKNNSSKRTVSTRSLKASTSISKEPYTSGLRRSNRGTPSKKPITPVSSTRKSERLASSPASVAEKSGGVKKKASSLQRSYKEKNESSADTEEKKDIKKSVLEGSTNQIKKRHPSMTGRTFRTMFGRGFKKSAASEKQLRKKDAGTNQVLETKTDGDSANNVAATSAQAARGNLGVCSCIAQPVQESDLGHMKETGPATSRDYGENRPNNTRSHVDSDAENSLDQQHRKACSIDKEIPDESVFPLPQPQDDQDMCPVPSSPAGKQPDTIEVAIEPQPAGSETVESGGFAASDQGDQDAPPLSLSTAEIQPETVANIEGQNLETAVDPVIAGPDAVEIGDSAASDQGTIGAQNACALPSSVDRSQSDLAANIEGQNITTMAQLHTAGSGPVASDEDGSPLPLSSPLNHPDTAVDIEDPNNTTIVEHHVTGSEPGPQVEQSTVANNLVQLVREGSVEPSAGVTAPVPSLTNNSTEQSAVQPVPRIPFPVFSDPFQYELEKLRRESENSKKTYEENKSILKVKLERKMAEIQAEYQRKFHEVDAEHNTIANEIEARKRLIMWNTPPRGRIHKLAGMNVPRYVSALPSAPTSVLAPAPVPAPPPVLVQPAVALQPQAFAARHPHPPILHTYKRRKGKAPEEVKPSPRGVHDV